MPTIRRLAKEGAVAEGMQTVNPAVTWPNHTAMVTGVTPANHGVLYNGMPVRGGEGKPLRVEPWVPKHELVLAPTVYDRGACGRADDSRSRLGGDPPAKDDQLVFRRAASATKTRCLAR